MIGIVDYGLGNLTSVAGAVERLEYAPVVTADAGELAAADKLILPGVGAFGDGMANLRERGLVEALSRIVLEDGKPILGICLGFQLIAEESEEFGRHEGLGWVPARVTRLAPGDGLRVPHVGWNELHQTGESILFEDVPDLALFYYVHSYRMETEDEGLVIGECPYGEPVVAAVQRESIYAVQFHPEKSQLHGLKLLENFLARA